MWYNIFINCKFKCRQHFKTCMNLSFYVYFKRMTSLIKKNKTTFNNTSRSYLSIWKSRQNEYLNMIINTNTVHLFAQKRRMVDKCCYWILKKCIIMSQTKLVNFIHWKLTKWQNIQSCLRIFFLIWNTHFKSA